MADASTVFVVMGSDYGDAWIIAVYNNREVAELRADLDGGYVEERAVLSTAPATAQKFVAKAYPKGYIRFSSETGTLKASVDVEAVGKTKIVERPAELKTKVTFHPRGDAPEHPMLLSRYEDGLLRVSGFDAQDVWETFWREFPKAQGQWNERTLWEHEHPYETVEVPKGSMEGFTGDVLVSLRTSQGGAVTLNKSQRVIKTDRKNRIQYVEPGEWREVPSRG